MMAGLLDPTDGVVRRGASGTVRASAVFQDLIHYPLTVRQNVALAAPEVQPTDERIMEALQAADAERLVADLVHGLDTLLQRDSAGGTDLSGGQWQRIAIARAIYAAHAGRELVILDEPTANLDVRAEAAFYEKVVRSLPNVTVVLILPPAVHGASCGPDRDVVRGPDRRGWHP
ncbi:MAG: ATP-binding cassette domain-containing protein, partial [Propionibacteriales bacterium]|nr:ATP-binding cassette domain-containing protein [Propionibacteriales bacterium]